MLRHYSFAAVGVLPDIAAAKSVTDREFFAFDYTFVLNAAFIVLSAAFLVWRWKAEGLPGGGDTLSDRTLGVLAYGGLVWLYAGLVMLVTGSTGPK